MESGFLRLVWSEDYECGQPLIDDQHRELFEGANRLLQMVFEGRATELRSGVASFLNAVQVHFDTEIELLREVGYQGTEAREELHRSQAYVAGGSDLLSSVFIRQGRFPPFMTHAISLLNK